MTELYTRSWIEENLSSLESWKQQAFEDFATMIGDHTYPCVPGRQGFMEDELRYGFLGDPRNEETYQQFANVVKEYTLCSRDTGKYASLALLFYTPEEMKQHFNDESYEQLFWSVLNGVSKLDEKEWPDSIPKDPDDHEWEFCFHGEPYFAFCATPAHQLRKSRHFSHFLIALQPRWVFDEINDTTAFGRKIKQVIRDRLTNYDKIPVHPSLKWYGQEDNYEWKQYYLRDDETIPTKCPFTRFKQKITKR
ncbi:YqcI/YcgG family protein [Pontibacillus yanchengensis]|uniref:YqcI/YcgG family protein n=1 Tax=Pontibacillus yanchengensis Y32 TaxID=1385514 RepID=A0A0A2TVS4_9BACI|nr:YqcI/YcgG family protein [Pontibacillus yanchengensis]KGP73345.1 hypothetical protein N782_05560 [Pontibacillus yanchengensis Y32]